MINRMFRIVNFWLFILFLFFTGFTGCGGGGGGGGTAQVDTTPPSISFSYPAESNVFYLSALPSYVALQYSDAASGINVSTLKVYYTMNERTIDLTGLFPKSSAANAAQSRTPSSETNPLFRSTASVYPVTDFSTFTPFTIAIPPTPSECDFQYDSVNSAAFLFCLSDSDSPYLKLNIINVVSGTLTESVLDYPISSLALAPALGKYYLARADAASIAVFNLSDHSQRTTIALPYSPDEVSFNPTENYLYISYKGQLRIDILDCTSDILLPLPISADYVPLIIHSAFSGGGFFILGQKAGEVWYIAYDSAGSKTAEANLSMSQQPNDVAYLPVPKRLYFSDTAGNRIVVLNLDTYDVSFIALTISPKELFGDSISGRLYAVSYDGNLIVRIDANSGQTDASYAMEPSVVTGETVFQAQKILLENIWAISNPVVECEGEKGILQAQINDNAGNTGYATRSICIRSESPP
ncbi:MAG: hypothetical protein AB1546_01965 [bacterium]